VTERVPRRTRKSQPAITIIDAIDDDALFASWFKRRQSWAAWRAFLKAMFALPLSKAELAIYQQCTGRTIAPVKAVIEAWLVCGRRAGKSFMLALIAVFLACFHDWRQYLAPGERATVMVIATDRRQARVIFRYISALLTKVPMLARMVERETADTFDLTNNVTIEISTASFRSVRGYTIVAALLDELAFWPTEDAAEPDHEVIAALRPAMATVPGAMLLCASSPYARRGAQWDAHRRHFGKNGDPLVWQADTRTMNKTVPQSFIDTAYETDPANAAAEYGAQFRTDVESFIAREVVEALVVSGRYEQSPVSSVQYSAFVDPSGGSSDSMTLAVAHKQDDLAILDAVREVKPPFSPEEVVTEFAALLKSYHITTVAGDRYAGVWPVEQFAKFGIRYDQSAKPKSDLYRDALPVLNSGKVELLDHPRLVAQLCSLERRTARGGRDSIDHAPGGHDDVVNSVAGVVCCLVAGNAADGWIRWAASEVERASEIPDEVEDDQHSTRQTPFYLRGNPKQGTSVPSPNNAEQQPNKDGAPKNPLQPIALFDNSYSNAYFGALSKAEGRRATLMNPKCSCCGRETVGTRISDGAKVWCDAGCQQKYATALAERNRARAIAENNGLPPTSQPVKQTNAREPA
jgi:hypothetical protein